ncbi:hypothetical protein SLA2020_412480 [Shorea laevis]
MTTTNPRQVQQPLKVSLSKEREKRERERITIQGKIHQSSSSSMMQCIVSCLADQIGENQCPILSSSVLDEFPRHLHRVSSTLSTRGSYTADPTTPSR